MTINRNSASLVNYDVILTGSGMRGSLRRCCLRWGSSGRRFFKANPTSIHLLSKDKEFFKLEFREILNWPLLVFFLYLICLEYESS